MYALFGLFIYWVYNHPDSGRQQQANLMSTECFASSLAAGPSGASNSLRTLISKGALEMYTQRHYHLADTKTVEILIGKCAVPRVA